MMLRKISGDPAPNNVQLLNAEDATVAFIAHHACLGAMELLPHALFLTGDNPVGTCLYPYLCPCLYLTVPPIPIDHAIKASRSPPTSPSPLP